MNIKELYQAFLDSDGITTDTRNIKKNGLFFALKGSNFNGNLFADEAIKNGAKLAIIDEGSPSKNKVLVRDVLKTLQDLASYHRKQFHIPFIGITGSNGKTTSKELLNAILETSFKVHYTKGNFNNHIGVPLTLLEVPSDTDIAIIEMGANHMGEIAGLCEIAAPTHGLITNCGKAHIEGFGSEENIKKGKGELYNFLKWNDGLVFRNTQQEYLKIMAQGARQIEYNRPTLTSTKGQIKILYNSLTIQTQLIGSYNLDNIASAIAIAKFFKVSDNDIKKGLESYTPNMNRSEIRKFKGAIVVLDAYNANPSSMSAALESFANEDFTNKTVILGDMFELGDTSEKEHQSIAALCQKLPFTNVVLVGKNFKAAVKQEGVLTVLESTNEAIKWFSSNFSDQCSYLVKGSRGMALERLLQE